VARWYYAYVLLDQGREREGMEQLAAALPRYRYHNPKDLQWLAQAYYKVHDLPNALRFQQELVGLEPESAAEHAALAQLYKESGDPADALREINIAVRLDGSYAPGAQAFVRSLGTAR
jgi:tetratricopeptide (TPR) repeat protein